MAIPGSMSGFGSPSPMGAPRSAPAAPSDPTQDTDTASTGVVGLLEALKSAIDGGLTSADIDRAIACIKSDDSSSGPADSTSSDDSGGGYGGY